jgi:ubiquinone/menaquinone biosynthesis C-methylase UbiE
MDNSHLEKERKIQNQGAVSKMDRHLKYSMRHLLQRQFDAIHNNIKQGDAVVEIGCGLGDFIDFSISRRTLESRYVGIDLSDECVQFARKRIPPEFRDHFIVEVGDAKYADSLLRSKRIPASFDIALMRGVIHHLEDPQKALEKIADLLSPGGRLMILEGNANSLYRRFVLGLADLVGIEHEASQFPHSPPEDVIDLLQSVGFKRILLDYVPGLFAPLSYMGVGKKTFWNFADRLEHISYCVAKKIFGWWYFLIADRTGFSQESSRG